MEPEFSVTNASNVFIVWQNQASNSKPNDILLKNSTDGGASFGEAINLSALLEILPSLILPLPMMVEYLQYGLMIQMGKNKCFSHP